MKVYQITEAPTVDSKLSSGVVTSVDIKSTTIIDPKTNQRIFKVVDQNGNELFRGTEEQANIKRDKLKKTINPVVPPKTSKTDRIKSALGLTPSATAAATATATATAPNAATATAPKAAGTKLAVDLIPTWKVDNPKMLDLKTLDPKQRAELKNSGRITVGGIVYTKEDIRDIAVLKKQAKATLIMAPDADVPKTAKANKYWLKVSPRVVNTLIPKHLGGSLALVEPLHRALVLLQEEAIAGKLTAAEYNRSVDTALGTWFIATTLPWFVGVCGGLIMPDNKFKRFMQGMIQGRSKSKKSVIVHFFVRNLGAWYGTKYFLAKENVAKYIAEMFKDQYIDDQDDKIFDLYAAAGWSAGAARSVNVTINREFPEAFKTSYKWVRDNVTGDVVPDTPEVVGNDELNAEIPASDGDSWSDDNAVSDW